MVDQHGQRIRDFLLDFAMNTLGPDGSALHQMEDRPSAQDSLRRELDRHNAPHDAVRAGHGAKTSPVCPVCREDTIQPCDVLRLLAVPYASHPAYRPEWRPSAPKALGPWDLR